MAGAGYKLFNTGDVLLASEVNTYLMQQTVMVFNNAAARTTALSGVVAEGMLSYLKDTNAVEVYDGANWVASDDPNAIQNTIVDAKGDLITATGADVPARLAVGNSGDTLVADSSAATGLSWTENYAAGKNKIINGDFGVNQRSFTTTTTTGIYTFDRWATSLSGGTVTYTSENFSPGAAPVAEYESTNFLRTVVSGQSATSDFADIIQRIEDVRTLAGQIVTFSFWAKADATKNIALRLAQNFGSGGSATVQNISSLIPITTSWARYSATFTLPSLSGKTIGSSSFLLADIYFSQGSTVTPATGLGIQNGTFDIWGIQIEASSVATAFQTATGTIQGELAACQRYYFRFVPGNDGYIFGTSYNYATTNGVAVIKYPVSMRIRPTALEQTGTASNYGIWKANTTVENLNAVPVYDGSTNKEIGVVACAVAANLTASTTTYLVAKTTTAYLGWSAEF